MCPDPDRCSPRGFFSVRDVMLSRYGAARSNGMTTQSKIDSLWALSHDQAVIFR